LFPTHKYQHQGSRESVEKVHQAKVYGSHHVFQSKLLLKTLCAHNLFTLQEVVAFVHKCAQDGKCPRQAAQELVKEARKRWQLQEDGIIDDCTAVVIYLEHDQVLPTTEHARVDVSLVQHKAGLGGCLPILKQGKLV
jgi:hypothetical protein